ncbi:MAG: serine/threonine protein kinase, partial [Planctomycetes bacterium]|nr:serine/threonine protein kinase [Planctomycetota bacterium]
MARRKSKKSATPDGAPTGAAVVTETPDRAAANPEPGPPPAPSPPPIGDGAPMMTLLDLKASRPSVASPPPEPAEGP